MTEVLEAVLDDDLMIWAYLRMRARAMKEKMKAYLLTLYMNPEEVASLSRVVAQESDHDSDSADSIYLTYSEEEAEQFQGML